MPTQTRDEPYNVGFKDYQWQLYCHRCPRVAGGGWQSVARMPTADSTHLTAFANAIVRHTLEVHGGE
jgi:hypothetical protein